MIGEPSKANGYELAEEITNSLLEAVQSGQFNSYTMSSGNPDGKAAVAKKYYILRFIKSRFGSEEHPIDPKNVFLTFGCSGALYCTFSALCEDGENILVPSPGFPLCHPIAQNLSIELKHYSLIVRNCCMLILNRLIKAGR